MSSLEITQFSLNFWLFNINCIYLPNELKYPKNTEKERKIQISKINF